MKIDWKKKYEEVLSLAKSYYSKGQNEFLDTLFPELRESEDERIRKGLVKLLTDASEAFLVESTGIKKASYLAWLEKQKEPKPIKRPKFKIGDVVKFKGFGDEPADDTPLKIVGYDNELYLFDNGTTDLFSEQDLYELVEQKPAEKQDYSGLNDLERAIHRGFLSAGVENATVTIIKETAQDCLSQMKSLWWSEEDEKILVAISKALGCDTAEKILVNEGVTLMMAAGFLESLRPQSKQEWSKIDEQISNGLIKALENLSSDWLKLHGVIKSDIIAWLKCHHNHLSWKPSEEQMEALDMVLTDEAMDDNIHRILAEMKKQLQELV